MNIHRVVFVFSNALKARGGGSLNRILFWKNWKTWQKALGLAAIAGSLAGCGVIFVIVVVVIVIGCSSGSIQQCIATVSVKQDPPASQLADFDASQASLHLSLDNISLVGTTGSATISIKDEDNGQLIAAHSFPYVISGNVATFQGPVAVNNWIHSFSDHGGNVEVDMTVNNQKINRPPPGEDGTLTGTALYADSPYGSATGYVSTPPLGGSRCPPVCHEPQIVQPPAPSSS